MRRERDEPRLVEVERVTWRRSRRVERSEMAQEDWPCRAEWTASCEA